MFSFWCVIDLLLCLCASSLLCEEGFNKKKERKSLFCATDEFKCFYFGKQPFTTACSSFPGQVADSHTGGKRRVGLIKCKHGAIIKSGESSRVCYSHGEFLISQFNFAKAQL